MKRVNGCKDVSIMSLQDEQWRRTSLLCLYTVIFSTPVCSQNTNKQNVNIADETLTDYSFLSILNQRIISKDDIEFVTEFPCLLGHPVYYTLLVCLFESKKMSKNVRTNRAQTSYDPREGLWTVEVGQFWKMSQFKNKKIRNNLRIWWNC